MSTTANGVNDSQVASSSTNKDPWEVLQEWGRDAVAALKDASKLDVSTFTGEVRGILVYESGSFQFKTDALSTALGDTVSLVAHTHIEIDQDQLLFVGKGWKDETADLLAAHNTAVQAATDARLAFVKALADMFPKKS